MFESKTATFTKTISSKVPKFVKGKTVPAVAGLALTAFAGSQLMTAEIPKKEDVYGQPYARVLSQFQEAGFENIQGLEMKDLEFGKIGESDLVEIISIDGEEWKEGRVSKSIPVTISYHGPKDDAVNLVLPTSNAVADVEHTLDQSGFTKIDLIPILLVEEGNQSKKDKIDRLEIGNIPYQAGYFYSSSLPVKLSYFDVSKDNIKLPETVTSAETKSVLEKQLKSAGFTDIKWTALADKDKSKHEKIQRITLGGEELRLHTKQDIISKRSTPINVTYYDFSSFAELPTSISSKTVTDTKKLFTDGGFSHISEVSTETDDISKNGQIVSVEIDGKVFDDIKDTVIKKDSKVIIKYWNAEKAIAEKARKEEEARLAAEAARAQSQIQQFASVPTETVYYKNCSIARAAGVTPILRGEPGYAKHLDRDGDGIACE